ncbi:MAG: helix-turn-helix domain-containing protein [Panacagrimonas sp.]
MKVWDTRTLAASQQFGFWREVLCDAFTALDSVPSVPRGYGSTVTLHEVGDVNAVELVSFAQKVVRGPDEIRRRADEFCFVNLQLHGDCAVEQDGRQILATPGSYYLVDTTRPYRLDFRQDFRALSFRIPHQALLPLLRRSAGPTARLVSASSDLGSLAVAHMHGLMRCAPQLPPQAASHMGATLAELISLSVVGVEPPGDESREQVRRAFRDSIVRFVESHSSDPGLSVPSVAAKFRVSARYVHAVFAERQRTFSQTVLERRLETAARALTESPSPVTTVALECGFGDPSYFGRAFHRRYGCSPREWRRASRDKSQFHS